MPGEVAQRKLFESVVAIRCILFRDPLLNEDERLLGAAWGSPANDAALSQKEDDVVAALALAGDAVLFEQRHKFRAAELFSSCESIDGDLRRPLESLSIEAQVSKTSRGGRQ